MCCIWGCQTASGTPATGPRKCCRWGRFLQQPECAYRRVVATQVLRAAMEGRIGFKEAYDLTELHGGAFQKSVGWA